MRIGSIAEAAATVRGRRADLAITQAELARRAGVSRKWVSEFEAGKPNAELIFILRVFEALELSLDATISMGGEGLSSVDLDALIEEQRHG